MSGRSIAAAVSLALSILAVTSTLEAQLAPRQPGQPTVPRAPTGRLGLGLAHACAPAEVVTTRTLVQVACRTAVQAKGLEEVHVFAVGVDDPAFASRVLRVAMSAQIAGHRVKITFNPTADFSGERLGCPARTCRLISTIALVQ